MDKKNKRKLIYYSALLHDIGKALERKKKKNNLETDLYKKFKEDIKNKKPAHPIYSAIFLEKHRKILKKVLNIDYSKLIYHTLNHHSCNNCDDLIILSSDWLSSFERELYIDIKSNYDENGELEDIENDSELDQTYFKSPLVNIFNELLGFQNIENSNKYKLNSIPLGFEIETDLIDNLHLKDSNEFGTENYRKVFQYIEKDIQSIKREKQIYGILKKYFSSIPSQTSTKKYPYVADISLFDHLKTSAAIALCLYDEIEDKGLKDKIENYIAKREEEEKKDKPVYYFHRYILNSQDIKFMLIHGDLSGIQDFLFNIPSKGAAKSLKGRSVYMNLLMEVVAKYIIDELNLETANLLYSGGGSFYILAPECKNKELEALKKEISYKIFKAHENQLYISLSKTIFSPKKFGYFNEVFVKALENTDIQKKRRWSELEKDFDEIFELNYEDLREEGVCKVCNKSLKKKETEICSYCNSLKELTDNIKLCNYEVWTKIKKKTFIDKKYEIQEYNDLFKSFGYNIDFKIQLEGNEDGREIISINDFNIAIGIDDFKFAGYKLPIKYNKSILELDEMADNAKGAKYVAMLKLDVDNLGRMFKEGFEALKKDLKNYYKKKINLDKRLKEESIKNIFPYQYRSISRITSLSRMISLFFEGYIPHLIETKYKNKIYLVYSGGDDTVAIGIWNDILAFHNELREKFDNFTCHNYYIDFSSAIGIYPSNFNLRMMAYQMEKGLNEAKSKVKKRIYKGMVYEDKEKNILIKGNTYFMGEVFNRKELDRLIEFKRLIYEILSDSKLKEHKALLWKILNSTKGLKACIKSGKINHAKYWRLAYYLRDLNNREDSEKIMDKYTELLMEFIEEDKKSYNVDKKDYKQFKNLMIIPSAVKWNELLFRGDKSDG